MLSDERIAEIAETHIGRLKDIGHKSGLVIRTDAELACESAIRAALTELAAGYEQRLAPLKMELECIAEQLNDPRENLTHSTAQCIASLQDRIRQLEAERVPEGWKLVPIEATQEMLKESGLYDDDTIEVNSAASMAGQIYRAMLAAAPQQKKENSND